MKALILLWGCSAGALLAQVTPIQPAPAGPVPIGAQQTLPGAQPPAATPMVRPNYTLGTNDQVMIRVPEAEELNDKPFRLDNEGNLVLPLIGSVPAAGLTTEQLEAELTRRLKQYFVSPHLSVTLVQFHGDPVFLVGPFQKPGIYTLQGGQNTLLDVLMNSGGLQSNTAKRIKITRRSEQGRIALPNTIDDPDTKTNSVEVNLGRLMESASPAENITLQPYDVLRAYKTELVFVNGEVNHIGGFPLEDRESFSAVQLITFAGGLTKEADGSRARVLRPIMDTNRRAEIPINLNHILAGRGSDFQLMPNDILIVPRANSFKSAATKPLAMIAPALATSLIFVLIRR